MEMFIVDRLRLISMIEEAYAGGSHDFIRDILLTKLNRLNIYGYEYKGYVGRVDSIKSYYAVSMAMLDEKIRKAIFGAEQLIYTKVKDQVPTKYGSEASRQRFADCRRLRDQRNR